MTVEPDPPPQSAQALNDLLRDMRRASAPTPREPLPSDPTYAEQLYARWGLTGGSNLSEVPQLRALLNGFPRQALHAEVLALEHPDHPGTRMTWTAKMPKDLQQFEAALRAGRV